MPRKPRNTDPAFMAVNKSDRINGPKYDGHNRQPQATTMRKLGKRRYRRQLRQYMRHWV